MDELNNIFGGAEQIWKYINEYASKAGREATRIVLELYYVVMSPNTPALDKTIIIAALAYQLLPEDFMSREKYGLLGLLDNGAALALAYNKVKSLVTPQIEAQVEAILQQWFGPAPQQKTKDPSSNVIPPPPAVLPQPRTIPSGGYDDEDVVID